MTPSEIEAILIELLRQNPTQEYGVTVADVSHDLARIDVTLRFLRGQTYCCAEPECHLSGIASQLASRAVKLPRNAVIRWHCMVEAGALIQASGKAGVPLESEAYEYDWEQRREASTK